MESLTRRRAISVFLLFVMILALFGFQMYNVQVMNTENTSNNISTYSTWESVVAARGEILDRNGNVLVTNRASYNLTFTNFVLFNSDDPNGSLRKLVHMLWDRGIDYVEHLPVTMEKPYEYTLDELDSIWRGYFKAFLEDRELDPDMSAAQLMKQLRAAYRIPDDWEDWEVRMVVGIRYELSLRNVVGSLPAYILVEDVSSDDLTAILELSVPGLSVQTSTVRYYATEYAAHILGTMGLMSPEQYAVYKEQGYPMDAYVGQTGLEAAFEEYLHGINGAKITELDADGNVISEYYEKEPVAGSNVETTIDINIQKAMEDALERTILELRANGVGTYKEGTDAEGGAAVAIDVRTGEILACASYPTFDLATYRRDYNKLQETEFGPLNNRALELPKAPGSVFKMVVTIAGINDGAITSVTPIEDKGIYTKYDDYQPMCLIYSRRGATHGIIDVRQALMVSCNYYFYETGIRTGAEAIDQVAKALGLGEPTGVELPEDEGRRSNAETKAKLYKDDPANSGWYDADTLQLSIGQGENRFTPLQLVNYVATLANRGTRYRATFLNRVISSDYQKLLVESKPEVMSTCYISDDAYKAYTEGMRMAVNRSGGTVYSYLRDYPVNVAAKTGTAQHGAGGSDNASFVCYAPYEDPQIAIAVFVEKGGEGGYLSNVAKAVMDVYFAQVEQENTEIVKENVGK